MSATFPGLVPAASLLGAPELAPAASRAALEATLRSFVPHSELTAGYQSEFLAALDAPGVLDRGLPVHLVSSAMVVHPASASALLILHPRFGRWQQPGGHADGDANLARVAVRETLEEAGLSELRIDLVPLDLDRHDHHGDRTPVAHSHFDVRFLLIDPSSAAPATPVSPEGHELAWFPLDELVCTNPDASLRRLAAAVGARLALA